VGNGMGLSIIINSWFSIIRKDFHFYCKTVRIHWNLILFIELMLLSWSTKIWFDLRRKKMHWRKFKEMTKKWELNT